MSGGWTADQWAAIAAYCIVIAGACLVALVTLIIVMLTERVRRVRASRRLERREINIGPSRRTGERRQVWADGPTPPGSRR